MDADNLPGTPEHHDDDNDADVQDFNAFFDAQDTKDAEMRARIMSMIHSNKHIAGVSSFVKYEDKLGSLETEELKLLHDSLALILSQEKCRGMATTILERGFGVVADLTLDDEDRKRVFIQDAMEDEELPNVVNQALGSTLLAFPAPVRCGVRTLLYWLHARFTSVLPANRKRTAPDQDHRVDGRRRRRKRTRTDASADMAQGNEEAHQEPLFPDGHESSGSYEST